LAVGAIVLGFCLAAHAAPKYKLLHSFNGSDGAGPYGGVTMDQKGNLYGTTAGGGPCGTVFELSPQKTGQWKETVLHQFASSDDGCDPQSNVILDASGNLYGTTAKGGSGTYHPGTVFELEPGSRDWTEKVLFDFDFSDGADPTAGLVMDGAGNLYGTTPGGGVNQGGVAFELAPGSGSWSETVLNSFYYSYYNQPAPGGSDPDAGLILDASGNLYGTTSFGGTGCSGEGCGTVYELTPESGGGWKETILHRFDNGTDGVEPGGGALFMDPSGNLYGTTEGGGASTGCAGVAGREDWLEPRRPTGDGNCGTVFKLARNTEGRWKETILYSFAPGAGGYRPGAGVVMDKSGNLYGTTDGGGGPSGCGVIYELAPKPKGKWAYTVLHTFGTGYDGCVPAGNLVLDSKGNLYGGTILGGTAGQGTVFEITP
jgi:uncharacterized repeat protein (TIGR03803 family)